MFNSILTSSGIVNSLSTFDILVIIFVCSVVEIFKQKVFHNNSKFKSLCPYVTVVLSFLVCLVCGLVMKTGDIWTILGKGIIDGALAVLCYDSVIAKVKKAIQKGSLKEDVEKKVDAVLGTSENK